MIRQRVHLRRRSVSVLVARLLVSLLALGMIVYGAMVVLAACKVGCAHAGLRLRVPHRL